MIVKAENTNEIRTYLRGALFCYRAQYDDFSSQVTQVPNSLQEKNTKCYYISDKYKNYNQ